jgi:hypothetical protein
MKNKKSKTISIVLPNKLEKFLQKEADKLEISRSRHICNILFAHKNNKESK